MNLQILYLHARGIALSHHVRGYGKRAALRAGKTRIVKSFCPACVITFTSYSARAPIAWVCMREKFVMLFDGNPQKTEPKLIWELNGPMDIPEHSDLRVRLGSVTANNFHPAGMERWLEPEVANTTHYVKQQLKDLFTNSWTYNLIHYKGVDWRLQQVVMAAQKQTLPNVSSMANDEKQRLHAVARMLSLGRDVTWQTSEMDVKKVFAQGMPAPAADAEEADDDNDIPF